MKRSIVFAAALALLAAPLGLAPAGAAPAPPKTVSAVSGTAFQAKAYGTQTRISGVVTSGASAPVTIGCTTTPGQVQRNATAGVDDSPLLVSGTVKTTARTAASPTTARSTSTVQDVNLLSGLITGSAVRAVSTTRLRGSGLQTSSAGTTFTSLLVAGIPIDGNVDPNTRIDVPGFGYVVLNQQTGYVGKRTARLTVTALHLVITQVNALGIPVGADAVVGRAMSGLSTPAAAGLDGFAYGTLAKVGSGLSSGPSFRVTMPCFGTNGHVKVDTGAGVSVEGVLQTGAITNTAQGTIDADSATGETTSSVDSADVLAGLVSATVVKADAHASSDAGGSSFSDDGSSFGTLAVRGFPGIGADTPPNTHVRIAHLGTLWLHRVVRTGDSIEVRMIELVVKHANSSGLRIGSDVQVAVAHASVH